jgi:hypothetical protein
MKLGIFSQGFLGRKEGGNVFYKKINLGFIVDVV